MENKCKQITSDEMSALQYLAGYVVRKFTKKAKNSSNYKTKENQSIILILKNAVCDNYSDQELIHNQSRGGLIAVTKDCQKIFLKAELSFRNNTNYKHLNKIDIDKMTYELLKDAEVVSLYNVIIEGSGLLVDNETKKNLLENTIKLYIRVRAFSLAKDITTNHKIKTQQKKAEGGLRKNIKNKCKVNQSKK